MPLNIAKWKETKQAALDFDRKETRHIGADVKQLAPAHVEAMVNACLPPLVAFTDGYAAHFLGDDAKVAAGVLGVSFASPVEGQPHVEIDTRQWNDAVAKLNAAGHKVSHTDVDE